MGNFNYQAVANQVASNRSAAQNYAAFMQLFQKAPAAYQQQQLNQLADKSAATSNALPATAVTDPDTGAPIIDAVAPDPQTEKAYNSDLGYGWNTDPSVPKAGGVAGFQLRNAMQTDALRKQQLMQQISTGASNQKLIQAKAAMYANKAALPPGLTPNAQGVQDRFNANQAAKATDSDTRYAADLKAATGLSPSDLNGYQQNGGVQYTNNAAQLGHWNTPPVTAGGIGGAAAGQPAFSVEKSVPLDTYQRFLDRGAGINSGHPLQLNAPAIAAAKQVAAQHGAAIVPHGTMVKVKAPDGSVGSIPVENLDRAISNGYQQL